MTADRPADQRRPTGLPLPVSRAHAHARIHGWVSHRGTPFTAYSVRRVNLAHLAALYAGDTNDAAPDVHATTTSATRQAYYLGYLNPRVPHALRVVAA